MVKYKDPDYEPDPDDAYEAMRDRRYDALERTRARGTHYAANHPDGVVGNACDCGSDYGEGY